LNSANITAEIQQKYDIIDSKTRIYLVTDGIDSAQTRVVYQRYFDRFLNHIKIHDLQVLLDFSPKVIKQIIADYIISLRDNGVKRDSIKTQIAAILHFFEINIDDFPLDMKKFKRDLPPDETVNEDRPYTTEEIGQVLKDCDLRTKVAILLLCSSGMRIGALRSLQIGDLGGQTAGGNDIKLYKIQVYARTRDKYFTFCTPECYNVIQDYLSCRRRYGEELKDKSPLIREQFNADNPFTINSPRFVSQRGIEYMIIRALKRSGIRKPREIHMSHGFRKFFKSQCERSSSMRSINIELLMGHNIGVSGRYYRPTDSEVLEDYSKAIDLLTVDSLQRLHKHIEKLEGQQAEEIAQLKTRLAEREEYDRKKHEEFIETLKWADEMRRHGVRPSDRARLRTSLVEQG
jgi:integrase